MRCPRPTRDVPAAAGLAAQGAGRVPAPAQPPTSSRSPRPGAGKTTFALRIAAELLADGTVDAVTVVAPTEHLKTQWAQAAARVGIQLDADVPQRRRALRRPTSTAPSSPTPRSAWRPQVHRRRTHDPPDPGDPRRDPPRRRLRGPGATACKAAFEPAVRRLMLTGTPFRSDENPIPFVTYERGGDGLLRSRADSSYGYADALRDGVVRPVIFLAYSGETRWRTSAGDELAARLGEPMTQDLIAQAWRTALDPTGRLDAAGAAGRRRAAAGAAGRRHARRRRAGHRHRPADRPGVREAARADHRREGRGGALRRRRAPRRGSPTFADVRRSAGWSRCGWSPRASTSRGWPSASTPPAPPRRCTSPRRSAGSSGPAARARPPASSCPACRTCSGWPARWRPSATTCSARRKDRDGLRRRAAGAGAASREGQRRAGRSGSRRCRPPPSWTR